MALMKTLILALCIGHSAVLELPHRRRATVRHGPVPKSEAKEERVLLLVYLLVEVHVVDPSINWVLLGSDGAQKYKCSPSKEKSFSGFLLKGKKNRSCHLFGLIHFDR